MKSLTKQTIEQILTKANNGSTNISIANELNISPAVVSKYLRNNGIRKDTGRRNYVNTNFFKTIDNEYKAYILGFIVTDGNIHITEPARNHTISVYQKEQGILNQIQMHIGGKVDKQKKRDCYVLRISSKEMYYDLLNLGIRPNKSRDMFDVNRLKDVIPNELLVHFFRGAVDGDGTITLSPSVSYDFSPRVMLCGTCYEFILWFNEFFKNTASVQIRNRKHKPNLLTMYNSCFSGNNAIDVCYKLYNNTNIALPRKHKRARMIISFFS